MDPRHPAGTAEGIPVTGSRLALRALRPEEIDEQWQAMVTADPNGTPSAPDEARFRARLRRSGQFVNGWIDLAIDLGGAAIGRIQTFVPEGRPLPAGTFEVGIRLREDQRGKGYGREALTLLTGWLFRHAAAQAVQASTDPANVAMRTVFDRVGWTLVGAVTDYGRPWVVYRITRPEWEALSRPGPVGRLLSLLGALPVALPARVLHTHRCGRSL